MTDTSKTAKIRKRWYHLPSHCLAVNVLLNNITFFWFLLFTMCQSLHVAVNKCINWCFVHLYYLYFYLLFYYNNKVFMLMVNYKPHRHVFQGQNVDCACPVSRDLWVGGPKWPHIWNSRGHILSLIHIWRCRRSYACRSRWSPYH